MMTVVLLLLGCASEGGTCSVAEGDGVVTVDALTAEASGTWIAQGSSVQINVTAGGELAGGRMTLRLQSTADGVTAVDALDAGAFPVTFALGVAEQGAALWYAPQATASHAATDAAPGSLTVTDYDGELLEACFGFVGEATDGSRVEVVDASVRATPTVVAQ